MVNNIKFRGKTKDKNLWVIGDLIQDRDLGTCYIDGFDYYYDEGGLQREPFSYEVEPSTVGQYVGVNDKKGIEVFQGDICRSGDSIAKIIWGVNHQWACKIIKGHSHSVGSTLALWQWLSHGELEVIGNIYDNPKLLNSAKVAGLRRLSE